ncbi:MAG: ferritin-like fold-containing protein [Microbacteriaceae bacterium]
MAHWFNRATAHTVSAAVRPRRDRSSASPVNRVQLGELSPGLEAYLGHAAYLQLSMFQTFAAAVATAPTLDAKEALSRVAGMALHKHHALVAEMERREFPVGSSMGRYAKRIDAFHRATHGNDWYELVTCGYVVSGILNDFSARLAAGLPAEAAGRIAAVFEDTSGLELLGAELRRAIDAHPALASRLALWGRRLVGDTLLIARSALAVPELSAPDEARLEPVFTELIASHTRRMDALGLTA